MHAMLALNVINYNTNCVLQKKKHKRNQNCLYSPQDITWAYLSIIK